MGEKERRGGEEEKKKRGGRRREVMVVPTLVGNVICMLMFDGGGGGGEQWEQTREGMKKERKEGRGLLSDTCILYLFSLLHLFYLSNQLDLLASQHVNNHPC